MDPDANLREQLELAGEIETLWDKGVDGEHSEEDEIALLNKGARLAELVFALSGWLSSGGFLPNVWKR